ncbi:5'-nucleotidase [Paucihalobacter sp.]|uniref:5'-nucleotidase n=1 Tax=Paucihalobacter sp. TaxID=2850405 RepID=UPI002FE2BEBA
MTIKNLSIIAVALLFVSCKNDFQLVKIEGKRIEINDNLATNQDIENFVAPYRERINKDLDSVLAYAVDTYSKTDGHLNTAIGNLVADVVLEQSNPIFNSRTGNNIDFVLLNHGGIRSIISKGNVTTRTAFGVMPFENSVIVVALKGQQIEDLIAYLSRAKRAHPISGLQLELDKDFKVISSSVNGKPIEKHKIYYIATNDYLYNGGDGMVFFQPNEGEYVLDYKVRTTLIDYFKKVDTLNPVIDDRFTQKN